MKALIAQKTTTTIVIATDERLSRQTRRLLTQALQWLDQDASRELVVALEAELGAPANTLEVVA